MLANVKIPELVNLFKQCRVRKLHDLLGLLAYSRGLGGTWRRDGCTHVDNGMDK